MLDPDIIISSRLTSSRLPYKAALTLPCGNASIKATTLRCMEIKRELGLSGRIFVACPETEVPIYRSLCNGTDAKIIGGHPENVAQRMQQACQAENILSFVRVTGDNPYICSDVYQFLLEQSLEQGECVSLYHQKALPNGTIVSHISSAYIDKVCSSGSKEAEEHLVLSGGTALSDFIKNPPIPDELTWFEGRFCLDTPEDLKYIYENRSLSDLLTVPEMKSHLAFRLDVSEY